MGFLGQSSRFEVTVLIKSVTLFHLETDHNKSTDVVPTGLYSTLDLENFSSSPSCLKTN
jgi:hypothetical protein